MTVWPSPSRGGAKQWKRLVSTLGLEVQYRPRLGLGSSLLDSTALSSTRAYSGLVRGLAIIKLSSAVTVTLVTSYCWVPLVFWRALGIFTIYFFSKCAPTNFTKSLNQPAQNHSCRSDLNRQREIPLWVGHTILKRGSRTTLNNCLCTCHSNFLLHNLY